MDYVLVVRRGLLAADRIGWFFYVYPDGRVRGETRVEGSGIAYGLARELGAGTFQALASALRLLEPSPVAQPSKVLAIQYCEGGSARHYFLDAEADCERESERAAWSILKRIGGETGVDHGGTPPT